MAEDYQEEHRRKTSRVRSFMDIAMGTILIFIGLYFLLYETLGINVFRRDPSEIDYLIGGVFILYGAWRIYRG
ncbi:MAG TPA: hypothetical protein VFR58_05135, partial [Flavisolibacter sp.]|nr:hypothetical protein [Flavisolibacter sp.]